MTILEIESVVTPLRFVRKRARTATTEMEIFMDIMLIFVFVISAFLGVELISKVPSQLHTPLMSGTNAISRITVVGAITVTAVGVGGKVGLILGFLAIVFATINVVGGYLVTDRMLGMFKKKEQK